MSLFVFFIVYLYVNGSGSITSVGEERANLSAVVYLYLCGFCLERFFLWVLGMGYVILLWHSLSLPYYLLTNLFFVLSAHCRHALVFPQCFPKLWTDQKNVRKQSHTFSKAHSV